MLTTTSGVSIDCAYWYAIYTRYRHEKFAASELDKRKIELFLPTRKIKRRWSDRSVTIEEPLFKNYLFVKTDLVHKVDIIKIKGVVGFISAGNRPIRVDEREILSLRNIIRQEISIDPFPYLEKGDMVCVKSGAFEGTEGYIISKDKKKCKLVISIAAIKSSISIEIDSCAVEKV